jgi:hypothetical protein
MTAHDIKQSMGRVGFTAIAVSIAVRGLEQKKLADSTENGGYDSTYLTYYATDLGMEWLARNQDKLLLQKRTPATNTPPTSWMTYHSDRLTEQSEDADLIPLPPIRDARPLCRTPEPLPAALTSRPELVRFASG